jgi:hypothetical protein
MGTGMAETSKKYVVNIDFPTCKGEGGHKIHLNPFCQGSAAKDEVLKHYDPKGHKISRDGGPVYLDRDEALECIKGKKQLEWEARSARSFRACRLCRRLPDWDIDIE